SSATAGTFAYSPGAGTILKAGLAQTLSATFTPSDTNNYTTAVKTVTINVQKATASVTPNAASKAYGEADPTLTGTLNGFLAADNVTAIYARIAGETVAGGASTISATLRPLRRFCKYNISPPNTPLT